MTLEEHVRRGWKDPSLWPPWPGIQPSSHMGQVSELSGKLAVEQRKGRPLSPQATWKGQYQPDIKWKKSQ